MTVRPVSCFFFFFFNDTATTEIYTLSLHDALPISLSRAGGRGRNCRPRPVVLLARVSSLCQQKEARRGDRVAESLGRLDISRLDLGPGLGVRARPQRSPSISARAAATGARSGRPSIRSEKLTRPHQQRPIQKLNTRYRCIRRAFRSTSAGTNQALVR